MLTLDDVLLAASFAAAAAFIVAFTTALLQVRIERAKRRERARELGRLREALERMQGTEAASDGSAVPSPTTAPDGVGKPSSDHETLEPRTHEPTKPKVRRIESIVGAALIAGLSSITTAWISSRVHTDCVAATEMALAIREAQPDADPATLFDDTAGLTLGDADGSCGDFGVLWEN